MLDAALLLPSRSAAIDLETVNIASVKAPRFNAAVGGEALCYGLVHTSTLLDSSIGLLASVLPDLIKLAEIEKTCDLLTDEIVRANRRVYILEHELIPDLIDNMHFTSMKCREIEFNERVRYVKIKDLTS
jgi:V/A-type H+-transporting ATPase subunit D